MYALCICQLVAVKGDIFYYSHPDVAVQVKNANKNPFLQGRLNYHHLT